MHPVVEIPLLSTVSMFRERIVYPRWKASNRGHTADDGYSLDGVNKT